MDDSTLKKQCKILHTSDWHLRDSQYASPSRGDDFTAAAMAVIDIAMGYGVQAICNSGDILNNKRPSSRNIRDLVDIDRRLQAAGIPMYVISGNHDFSRPSWVSILDEETQQKGIEKTAGIINADYQLHTVPGTDVTLYGIPSIGARAFRETRDEWPDATILMSHELVSNFAAFKTDEDTLSVDDYPTDRYPVVLLGDIHTYNYYQARDEGKLIGYPGSIELCSQNEPVDKYVSIIPIEDGKVVRGDEWPEKVNIPSRKALFYRVITEDQADQALTDLKTHIADDPIVLVKYDSRMHAVPQMFMTVVAGSQAILRCSAFSDVMKGLPLGLGGGQNDELANLKELKDFVSDYIPPGTELHRLATALADPDADHKQMISDYVNERIKIDETDSFEDPGYRQARVAG